MSEKPRCETCRHWKKFQDGLGFCKRYPPYPSTSWEGDRLVTENVTPVTDKWDSCGEHAPK
jgi:hypothetical protein